MVLGYVLAAFFGLMGLFLIGGSIWTISMDELGGSLFWIVVGVLLIGMANYFYQVQRGNIDQDIGYTIKDKK